MALIAVADDGTGIPVELRDKLFSPSFTTKSSGMGLGLAIVKNIVENFSGRIWFETELDKGTTFFTLKFRFMNRRLLNPTMKIKYKSKINQTNK